MADVMETILIILPTASAMMAFHVFTALCSHLRENLTSVNSKAEINVTFSLPRLDFSRHKYPRLIQSGLPLDSSAK